VPFWDAIRAMSDRNAQYDTIMLPDGDFRPDDFTGDRLEGYPMVIIPDAYVLTENQQRCVLDYAAKGGKVLVLGRLAEGTGLLADLLATGNAVHVPIEDSGTGYMDAFLRAFADMYEPIAPAACQHEQIGIQRFDDEQDAYVHILNYNYNAESDCIEAIPELKIFVRDVKADDLTVIVPENQPAPEYTAENGEDGVCVTLKQAGLYTVLTFAK